MNHFNLNVTNLTRVFTKKKLKFPNFKPQQNSKTYPSIFLLTQPKNKNSTEIYPIIHTQ